MHLALPLLGCCSNELGWRVRTTIEVIKGKGRGRGSHTLKLCGQDVVSTEEPGIIMQVKLVTGRTKFQYDQRF